MATGPDFNATAPAGVASLLDTRTSIETPEHVTLSYHVAGPIRRGLAWGIDTAVRGALLAGLAIVLGLATEFGPDFMSGVKSGLWLLLAFLLEWGYFVAAELLMSGRSPGKKVLGLRVVTLDGLPVGLGDSVLRNLLRGADFLPVGYVLGVACMLLDARFRRLGDLVGNTLVIFERKVELKEPLSLSPPPSAEELTRLEGRVKLSEPELEAIELFLRRKDELSSLRADELSEILAAPLAKRARARYQDPTRFLGLCYFCHTQGRS